MSLLTIVFACLLFGGLAGLLAGLFGIGGGLVLVPFFVFLFDLQGFDESLVMIMAVATSLATINVTALSAILAHQRHGAIVWSAVQRLVPGVLAGGLLGAWIADDLPAAALRTIFAVFMCYVSLQMALQKTPRAGHCAVNAPLLAGAGTVIGALSAIIGIGGGTLTVPLLVKLNYPLRNAVAISSACGLPIAFSGTASYALLGWHKSGLPDGSLGYIYLPAFFAIIASSILLAPLGAKLAHQLPARKLQRYFAALLFVVAVRLWWH
jgi:uncharacterized membrane protein YfcA